MGNATMQVHDVLAILRDLGYIRSIEIIPFIKPGHGPCCTCQTCGYPHDECVCDDNELIQALQAAAEAAKEE